MKLSHLITLATALLLLAACGGGASSSTAAPAAPMATPDPNERTLGPGESLILVSVANPAWSRVVTVNETGSELTTDTPEGVTVFCLSAGANPGGAKTGSCKVKWDPQKWVLAP